MLNFNKDGDSHSTLLGGIGGLCVKGFMCIYIFVRCKMFLLNEADNNFTENGVINLDEEKIFRPRLQYYGYNTVSVIEILIYR